MKPSIIIAALWSIAPLAVAAVSAAPLALDLSGLGKPLPAVLEIAPVKPNAVTVAAAVYVVRANDTPRSVGNATGVGRNAIIRANQLPPPYVLRPGQSLVIPAGRYHRVSAGETGIAIARAYGIAWLRIVDANGLAEPVTLRAEQRLVLPGGTKPGSVARSIEQRASAFTIGIDDIITGSEPARVLAWTPQPVAPRNLPLNTAPRTFLWPTAGDVVERFGSQGRGRINQGVDIAASPGSGVRAAARGEVAFVGGGVPGYGGLILVRHDGGWISAYGRVDSAAVSKGTRVAAGQIIGRSGSDTVHFELRRARIAVDPMRYLPARS